MNFFVSANYNQRKSISNGTTDRITYDVPNTSLLQTDESIQNGNFTFLRAGIDYFIDNRNTISFAGNIGREDLNQHQKVKLLLIGLLLLIPLLSATDSRIAVSG